MIPTLRVLDAVLQSSTGWFARLPLLRYHSHNTPATLSPVSTGDAHNWRVFIA